MKETDTIARAGYVSALDFKKHAAKVTFPDLGITSAWLPVLVPNTHSDKDKVMPAVGEHVAALLTDNTGFILGSLYDDKNPPFDADEHTRSLIFADGTTIEYNKQSHEMTINDYSGNKVFLSPNGIDIEAKGNMNITASGNIKISATRIDLN